VGKFRSILFVIDLQGKAKEMGFLASQRTPSFKVERQRLLQDIFTFNS